MLLHDVSDVFAMEWKVKEAKRQKWKRKHQTSFGTYKSIQNRNLY